MTDRVGTGGSARRKTISPRAFHALAKLLSLRPDTRSYQASWMVLVDGLRPAEAMRATGLQRASVTKSVRRCEKGMELARQAVGLDEPARPSPVRPLVSIMLWERIKVLFPVEDWTATGRRPVYGDRELLNGILHVLRHRLAWHRLPPELGWGSGRTCLRRLHAWQRSGAWPTIREALLDLMPEAALIDWKRADALAICAEVPVRNQGS